jgi:hypothetical protein
MVRICTDFNAREGSTDPHGGGRVPLDILGAFRDIRKQNVELKEGMRIIVYHNAIQAAAIVEKYQGQWHGRLIGNITIIPKKERRYPEAD